MKQMSDVETTTSSRPPRLPLPMGFPRRRCDENRFAFTIRGPMLQGTPGRVSDFYDHHPINATRVLEALSRPGLGRPGPVTADDLFAFDQDHYGGLAAVDALARRAGIGSTSRVLDVCAGLGGPARFVASRRGSIVVALELHRGRAAGAARLNRLVRQTRVTVVRADATALPFRPGAV